MSDHDKINKAVEILKKHRIGEITTSLLDDAWLFASTPEVRVEARFSREYLEESAHGVLLGFQSHELAVATTDFRASAAPDDRRYYADGLVYFDGDLVLRVGATRNYGEHVTTTSFGIYPFSLKSMKAGPWLEMLGTCHKLLMADLERRKLAKEAEKARKQANEIDLGDY